MHPHLDGWRPHPLRDFRPQARCARRIPWRIQNSCHHHPRRVLFRAHEKIGRPVWQVICHPLHSARSGQPRSRQPLHDDRRAAPHSGRLWRFCQLPSQHGIGCFPRVRRASRGATLLQHVWHGPVGRTQLFGRKPRSLRSRWRPQQPEFPCARCAASLRYGFAQA